MSALLTPERTSRRSALPARPHLLRRAWRRIHPVLQEMNYGARRTVELQAPWSIDQQWHQR